MSRDKWTDEEAAVQAECWDHGFVLKYEDLTAEVDARRLQDADWRRRWMNREHCGGAIDRVCPGGCPCQECGC